MRAKTHQHVYPHTREHTHKSGALMHARARTHCQTRTHVRANSPSPAPTDTRARARRNARGRASGDLIEVCDERLEFVLRHPETTAGRTAVRLQPDVWQQG